MKRTIAVLLAAALLSACTSAGRIRTDTTLPSKAESFFVVGVDPDNYRYRVSVFPGKVKDGHFQQNPLLTAAFYGAASGGYIVGKASANQVLAITNVRVVKSEGSVLGADFAPCGDAQTVVFDLPGGRVQYLGHFSYSIQREKCESGTSRTLNQRKRICAKITRISPNPWGRAAMI